MIFLVCSASMAAGLTGMIVPMILMLMGEPAEMKMSEAFFSAISCRSFSMNMCALPGLVAEQLVDAGLRAGPSVDLSDDHRTIETIPAIVTRTVAPNDHATGGTTAPGHLSGLA